MCRVAGKYIFRVKGANIYRVTGACIYKVTPCFAFCYFKRSWHTNAVLPNRNGLCSN